ncbi:3-oxoacyl-ACP synthase III family protein [Desulfococcus sp.]|uniref:3-oxoacyl-ACP synthase III family protein n=1 Tax=Desulfococcus sp. TaxID=2025834 RepID=UPI003592FD00
MANSIITRTGSYIPTSRIPNTHFRNREFYGADGVRLEKPNADIILKLQEITGIRERRYAADDQNTSDIAFFAAEKALAGIDAESLDYIIVAQNLGDISPGNIRADMVPTIASRVKHRLRIKNPYTVAYDIPFGCPGWLHGMILADYYIKSGDAAKVLVIGAEILSRVSDPHDIDSMIFADGAGAALVEATDQDAGIVAHLTRTDAVDHAYLLRLGRSYNPDHPGNELYIKMDGHDIYKYALKTVPEAVKKCLDKAGHSLTDVRKVLIHQANEKMDAAILARLFKLCGVNHIPDGIMPMTISWLGNSSVATLPTMLDLLYRDALDGHRVESGDIVVFASVGAGMNINVMVYRMP